MGMKRKIVSLSQSKIGALCKDCTPERPGKTHGVCYVVHCACIYHKAYTTRKPNSERSTPHATREEQHQRYIDCGPNNWDDRD